MIERFQDIKDGMRRLLDALQTNNLINGDESLAKKVATKLILKELQPNEILIKQDGEDNDLYFIISGELSVLVNKREVATRKPGSHVGEMALLDPTAVRSATVVAKTLCVVGLITEADLSEIGNKTPLIWRRIAVELASRLKERAKFVLEPNNKPHIFIGSSSEHFKTIKEIQKRLEAPEVVINTWTEGVFQVGKASLDSLLQTARAYDFAILFLTPDDVTESRGSKQYSPRDNVIFELGLFMGTLGSERTLIVARESTDIKIPSDLLGITRLVLKDKSHDETEALAILSTEIKSILTKWRSK